jgi:lysophospholipase L1-like esterase
VIAVLKEALEALFVENPSLQVTFTLSPFRYKKYGWHGSQLSKATLMLAIDTLQREYPELVDYFPSYEIMMDELRDYRYYAEDGLHPSMEAVDIIWNKLCE